MVFSFWSWMVTGCRYAPSIASIQTVMIDPLTWQTQSIQQFWLAFFIHVKWRGVFGSIGLQNFANQDNNQNSSDQYSCPHRYCHHHHCYGKNKKKQQSTNRVADYRTTRVIDQPQPKAVVVTERRGPPTYPKPKEFRQAAYVPPPSLHSDSSEELAYFDRPWQNFGDDLERRVVDPQYSEPRKRRNPIQVQIQPVSQRVSDQSQNPNTIVVLEGDDNEERYYNNRGENNTDGTYI